MRMKKSQSSPVRAANRSGVFLHCNFPVRLTIVMLLLAANTHAQWVAYNDHSRGTGTAPNVCTYSLAAGNSTVGGPLTNFTTGTLITPNQVGVSITHVGILNGATAGSSAPNAGTPAAMIFGGKVEWSASSLYFGTAAPDTSRISFTFTNLTPGRLYKFRGTGVRGGSYPTRWTLATLAGAISAKPAHQVGTGSLGIITNGWSPYGNTMAVNFQAAWNSGNNLSGDVIGWDDIQPIGTSFSVINSNWTVATPGGAGNSTYCYAFSAFMLEELAPAEVSIVSQPQAGSVCPGQPLNLAVGVVGALPIRFQWRKDGTNLLNATNQNYTVASATPDFAGDYTVVISNAVNSVTSIVATVVVSANPLAITSQPQDQAVVIGLPAAFSVGTASSASRPISCQWYVSGLSNTLAGTTISGATNQQLTITNTTTAGSAFYYAILGNCVGTVTSSVASLVVSYLPLSITSQPTNQTVYEGVSATLAVGVIGSIPSYQWFKGTTAISGATNASLVLTNVRMTDSGFYHAVVSNPAGSASSRDALFIVGQAPRVILPLTNQVWKYDQTGLNLGTNWRLSTYDDSSWASGLGVFAKEDLSVIVALTRTPLLLTNTGASTATLTYYFRTQFVLSNNLSSITIVTSNLINDGSVVYLNGTEAYRINMPAGTISSGSFASTTIPEGVFIVTNLPSDQLIQGTNTLAVEVHQLSSTSSDVTFGFAAVVSSVPPSLIRITSQPQSLTVSELEPASVSVGYVGDTAILQWFKDSVPIPGATKPTLTFTNAQETDTGHYFVVISNVLGSATSQLATLTVLVDNTAPTLWTATRSPSLTEVAVVFSEAITLSSATEITNYAIWDPATDQLVTVRSATLTNGSTVLLATDPLSVGKEYVLTVNNVQDASPRVNRIAANSRIVIGGLTMPLVPINAAWEYDDTGHDLGTYWRNREFDDSAWRSGAAVLFNDNWLCTSLPLPFPTNTVLSLANPAGEPIVTHYFRHRFNFPADPDGAVLVLRPVVDDGAVFYLNGQEIYRVGVPEGVITATTTATRIICDGGYEGPVLVPVTNLVWGENVLAVETHQSLGVMDVAFGVAVDAIVNSLASLSPYVSTQPQSQTVAEGQPVAFTAVISAPGLLQWLRNGVPIPFANHSALSISSVSPADNGAQFTLYASNAYGAVTSAPATLTVVSETIRPELISAMLASNNAPFVIATFSEPLDSVTATNPSNYALIADAGFQLGIVSASLSNGSNVVLNVGEWLPAAYTLVVNGVKDRAIAGNEIIADSRATVGISNAILVALNAETLWQYNQQNVDLGIGWRGLGYDDSAPGWQTGAGLFDGKWDPYSGTVIERSSLAGQTVQTRLLLTNELHAGTIPTYYFRARLVIPLAGAGATIFVRQLVDEGVAYYLNGNLLYSVGVTVPTTFSAWGNRTIGDVAWETASVPVPNLAAGTSLLAAEVKNGSATSSDITFGAELMLNVPSVVLPPGGISASPDLQIIYQPQNTAVSELTPALFTMAIAGKATSIQWYKCGLSGPQPVLGAITSTLKFSRPISGVDDGVYFAVLSTPTNQFSSADATLTVTQSPPFIVTQPASQIVNEGQSTSFQVVAHGSRFNSFQWRFNNTDLPNATNTSYSIPAVAITDVGTYTVLVSNTLGVVTSAVAQLALSVGSALDCTNQTWSLADKPWFTQTAVTHDGVAALQTADTSSGGYSIVQTEVNGPGKLSFWWKKEASSTMSALVLTADNVDLAKLSIPSDWVRQVVFLPSGNHTIRWTFNGWQAAWLDQVTYSTNLAPEILSFPGSALLFAGANLTLQTVVDGYPPLHCQWYHNEQPIFGATSPTLKLMNLQATTAGAYSLVVTNQHGFVATNVFLAVIGSPPGFMPQPVRLRAFPGATMVIPANALGSDPRTYQWRFEGVDLPTATNATLTLAEVSTNFAGYYSVTVSNASGWAVGPEIELTVGGLSSVIHISVDGLGAKWLAQALQTDASHYPNFARFVNEGCSTLNARCDYTDSITVPNHLSMITGRPVRQPAGQPNTVAHGFLYDSTPGGATIHNSGNTNVPYKASVFDVVHDHGLPTAFLAGKTSLTICTRSYDATNGAPDLVPPDNGRSKIDYVLYGYPSSALVDAFLPSLTTDSHYGYAFLHFAEPDGYGHNYGWGSFNYYHALQIVDNELGRILTALETSANPTVARETAVIVTADHGGIGSSHVWPELEYDYTIPLLVWGPGLPAGTDLYSLFANRADPGTNWLDYNAVPQPLRNGDSGNLALALLGLPPIPGSTLIPMFPTSTLGLTLVPQGETLSVEWSAAAVGFALETATSLAPDAIWLPVTTGIATNVNNYRWTIPPQTGPRFYRLRK